jgi:hypothetical protein
VQTFDEPLGTRTLLLFVSDLSGHWIGLILFLFQVAHYCIEQMSLHVTASVQCVMATFHLNGRVSSTYDKGLIKVLHVYERADFDKIHHYT